MFPAISFTGKTGFIPNTTLLNYTPYQLFVEKAL